MPMSSIKINKRVLIKTYCESEGYQQFAQQQLEPPVEVLVNKAVGLIERYSLYGNAKGIIERLKGFLSLVSQQELSKCSEFTDEGFILRCAQKDVECLRRWFSDEMPQDESQAEQYLEFISEVTRRIIKDVCRYAENFIRREEAKQSYAERFPEEAKPSSFVERVRPYSPAEEYKGELDQEEEQTQSKKTVWFAEPTER